MNLVSWRCALRNLRFSAFVRNLCMVSITYNSLFEFRDRCKGRVHDSRAYLQGQERVSLGLVLWPFLYLNCPSKGFFFRVLSSFLWKLTASYCLTSCLSKVCGSSWWLRWDLSMYLALHWDLLSVIYHLSCWIFTAILATSNSNILAIRYETEKVWGCFDWVGTNVPVRFAMNELCQKRLPSACSSCPSNNTDSYVMCLLWMTPLGFNSTWICTWEKTII